MIRRIGLALALVLTATVGARAQTNDDLSPEQRRALEALALADARSAMLQRVAALPLTPGSTVRDAMSRSVDLDRALRLWVRRLPRVGKTRIYSDGVAEANVQADAAELHNELERLLEAVPGLSVETGLTTAIVQSAARSWQSQWATGRAVSEEPFAEHRPVGWENVTNEGMDLARRAAMADAHEALLRNAARLPVTNALRLEEFLATDDAVRAAARTALERTAVVSVEYAADQVAVATAELSIQELHRILTRVHQEHYRGTDFAPADFRQMVLLAKRDELTATGLAAPPERTIIRARPAPLELNAPAWATETRTARGQFFPTERVVPEMSARLQAAYLDALDHLHETIMALVIQRDVTVAEFIGYHQELKPDITLFLTSAHIAAPPRELLDDGVEVTVELPLRRFWEILRRKMRLVEAEPGQTSD